MSKLIEKLEQLAHPAPRRLGFAVSRDEAKASPLLLVVRLESDSSKLIKESQEPADAAILRVSNIDSKKSPIKDITSLKDGIPWGVQAEVVRMEEVEGLRQAGCDYLVFGIKDTPGCVLNEENIGKILSIEVSLEEQLMRVLEEMPTDAIFIEFQPEPSLTVKGLMTYRSVISYVSKPVIALVSLDLQDAELTALQNVGVVGIVVEPHTPEDMKKVSKLRKAIESLPPREPGEKSTVSAIVPHPAPSPTLADSMPDEEDA
ncbi:MAG: hypothetical protein ACE5JL_17855 [Dehalococcoidia bacterium]